MHTEMNLVSFEDAAEEIVEQVPVEFVVPDGHSSDIRKQQAHAKWQIHHEPLARRALRIF